MKELSYKVRLRIIILFTLLLIGGGVLIGRVAWIQLFRTSDYQELAIQQRLKNVKVEPNRGFIYDRSGADLAVSASADTVVAAPPDVENPDQVAEKLAAILDGDREEIYDRLTRKAAAVYVARKIDEEEAAEIRELNLSGIYFTEESRRFYPKDNLAAHILGFTGIDNQGLQGVELAYDSTLRGIPGRIAIESDAMGREIPEGISEYITPEDGNDLHLTTDYVLQYIAERELNRALQEHEAQGGTIMMMDPTTGEILAIANEPSYNPNEFAEFSPRRWRNRAISDSYEPGSTFKIVTAAAGLEEGVVRPNDKFHDPGYIEVAGQKLQCWKDGGHGEQTFSEVVQNSCNPGFVQVGQRVGEESFYDYIDAFGFGEKTEVRMPGEAKGLIYNINDVGPVELGTMSFGHGISVTPMQLISAVSAVANNGQLLRPQIVKEIRKPSGELIEEKEPELVRQVISKDTAETLRKLLTGVVEEGSGEKAAVEGYNIGGKTGTAKHYQEELYDSSFIGLLPAEDPQLVTLVVLYGVSSYPYYGSQVAAPIFREVVSDAVRRLEISPIQKPKEEEEEVQQVEVPNVKNLTLFEAEEEIRDRGLEINLEGRGEEIVDQVPQPGAVVKEGSTVILFFSGFEEEKIKYQVTVPDLEGKTVEEAADLLGKLGLRFKWSGSGRIQNQRPVPGTTIDYGEYVEAQLE